MSDLLIKKYPNRRLYDTANGIYVTLSDLRQLVKEAQPIKIIDTKTAEDVTCSVLLQVLVAEEQDSSVLSADQLQRIIRLYDSKNFQQIGQVFEAVLCKAEKNPPQLSVRA